MKYFLTILTALCALATVCVFVLFVSVFIMWLRAGFNVVLPGLGLVISAPLILVAIFITGAVLLAITLLLFRTIYKPLR